MEINPNTLIICEADGIIVVRVGCISIKTKINEDQIAKPVLDISVANVNIMKLINPRFCQTNLLISGVYSRNGITRLYKFDGIGESIIYVNELAAVIAEICRHKDGISYCINRQILAISIDVNISMVCFRDGCFYLGEKIIGIADVGAIVIMPESIKLSIIEMFLN